jgi:uncharacterized phage protein gp47/JayE
MPQRAQTFTEFRTKAVEFLSQQTQLSNFAPGSTIASIVDVVSLQSSELSSDISQLSLNLYLDTASSYYLDLIAEMFGIERYRGASVYKTTAGDKTIKFYVQGVNTLARVLGTTLIKPGTTIKNLDSSVSFSVDTVANFNQTDTHVFVSATASSAAKTINLGPDQLVKHNLNNANLFVTNTNTIYHSSGVESDASFRSRISSVVTALEGPNQSSIISSLRRYSDVSDIIIRPNVSGTGTYDVFLLPVGNRISSATLLSAANLLNHSSGFGINAIVREFDYIPIKAEIKVTFSNESQIAARETIMNSAEVAVQSAIGSMSPGETLSMSRISTAVLNISPLITSAEVVYLCINKRISAIVDLILEEDELFVPDPDEINPIMVRQ